MRFVPEEKRSVDPAAYEALARFLMLREDDEGDGVDPGLAIFFDSALARIEWEAGEVFLKRKFVAEGEVIFPVLLPFSGRAKLVLDAVLIDDAPISVDQFSVVKTGDLLRLDADLGVVENARIELCVGVEKWAELEAEIQFLVLKLAAHNYENRLSGGGDLPPAIRAGLQPFLKLGFSR